MAFPLPQPPCLSLWAIRQRMVRLRGPRAKGPSDPRPPHSGFSAIAILARLPRIRHGFRQEESVKSKRTTLPAQFPVTTVCAALLLAARALAQAPEGGASSRGVYRVGDGVTAPQVIKKTDPEYSEEARKARLQGTVLFRLIVDEYGLPRDLEITRAIGLGLDEKATEALSQWKFSPAMKDGQPVPVSVNVEINFRLLDRKSPWYLTRAIFSAPAGASPPSLDRINYPDESLDAPHAAVTIAFEVGPDGIPADLHVQDSSDPNAENLVLDTVRGWRFHPAMKDGVPVAAPAVFEFARGQRPRPHRRFEPKAQGPV